MKSYVAKCSYFILIHENVMLSCLFTCHTFNLNTVRANITHILEHMPSDYTINPAKKTELKIDRTSGEVKNTLRELQENITSDEHVNFQRYCQIHEFISFHLPSHEDIKFNIILTLHTEICCRIF